MRLPFRSMVALPGVGGIESEQVQVVWDSGVRGRGAIGVRAEESAVAVELDQGFLPGEARLHRLELARCGGGGRRFGFDVLGNEVETNRGDRHEAEDAQDRAADDDPDPGLDLTCHRRSSAHSARR
jgi:hypothetical protein